MTWKELDTRAYVPYSKIPRSCIIEGSGGSFFVGVRIENASFPLTISAIQAACAISLSEGERPTNLYVPHSDFDQLEFWKTEFELNVFVTANISELTLRSLFHTKAIEEKNQLVNLLDAAVIGNSDFPVSAILYSDNGWFEGVNVEVTDWALGLCAERVALAKAHAHGSHSLQNIAVHTKKGEFSSPCGACRQVLHEHIPLKKAKLHHADHTYSEHFVLDLLPFSFTSKDLRK